MSVWQWKNKSFHATIADVLLRSYVVLVMMDINTLKIKIIS